jgi:IS30 family transposase
MAVSKLPPDERESIEMAYLLGVSYRAAATRLGVPEGTVKSRIRRGLQRLRSDVELEGCFDTTLKRSESVALSLIEPLDGEAIP